MSVSACAEITEVLGGLDACADRLCELSFVTLDTAELLNAREQLQRIVRKLRVPGHAMVNQLAATATCEQLGGSLGQALANRLRISTSEANRCIAQAADLGPRRALTGEPLSPALTATAAAERQGSLGAEQVAIIQKFFAKLPDTVDPGVREEAEAKLALIATGFRPDQLAEYAQVYKDCLKPDGDFVPEQPERGPQTRPDDRPTTRRWDVEDQRADHPPIPRHPGAGAGQVSRPRHVQP